MPDLSGLLLPEPVTLWQTAAEPCLHRKHSGAQRQVWLRLLWRLLLLSLGPSAHRVLSAPSEHVWWV